MQATDIVTRATSSSQGMRTAITRLVTVSLLVMGGLLTANAQQTNATIVGNVTDSTGAVDGWG